MRAVAARLVALHEQLKYRITIIYIKPRHREIFEMTEKFSILDETTDAVVLDASYTRITPLAGRQWP